MRVSQSVVWVSLTCVAGIVAAPCTNYLVDVLAEKSKAFIDHSTSKPFFLYVAP